MTSKRILFTIFVGLFPFFGTAQSDTVEIHDSFFSPANITVAEGTEIVWVHMGSLIHTTTSGSPCTQDGTWDSGNLSNGQTFSYTFNSAGTFPYFCIPHCAAGMTGSVEVVTCSPQDDSITVSSCDSYTVPSGDETYSSSGNYEDTVFTSIGCDSIIYIDLTVQQSSSASIAESTCDTYTVPSGDETHSSSGTYFDTIPNAAGCDSVLTIDLTIDTSSSSLSPSICGDESYTVPSGDETYTMSGTYMDTLTNAAGCDSLITIDLTVDTSSSSLSPSICEDESYTVPSGDETYTMPGTYMDTLTNAAGCDSLITIELGIATPDTMVTPLTDTELEVAESGANYQWLDCNEGFAPITGETAQSFQASENGSYAVAVTVSGCTDTSSCHEITDVGILENGLDLQLRYYPNPTRGQVQLEAPSRQEALNVSVRDMQGQLIREERIEDPKRFSVSLGDQAGFYLIELRGDKGKRTTIKVLKEE